MKILVINIKFLGDLIISTPGLRALRKTFPSAEICFLLRKGYEEVLANNSNVNRIITFNPDLKGNSGIKKFFKGINFITKIRSEKFDTIIALHPGDRIAFWSYFSGAKIKIAPSKQSFGFLFNNLVEVEEDTISYLDYYNKIFSSLIGKIDSLYTEFFISTEDENWVKDFLSSNRITDEHILIGIHPSASEPTKILRAKIFVSLFKKLNKKSNIRLLLIEGPQDKNVFNEIMKNFNDEDLVSYRSGSISKTAALIKKCKLFITHDTGTRHLAVAIKSPVLALLPEDNLKCWSFYESNNFHYSLIGKRYIPQKGENSIPYLSGITAEDIYNKISEILDL